MRRALGRAFFGMLVVGLLVGCSPPVQVGASNREPSYQGKITRVLVVTSLRAPGLNATQNEGFVRASEIRQSLNATWSPLGVALEVIDMDPSPGMPEQRTQFAPQQILTLAVEGYTLYRRVVDSYAVDASLYEVSTGKRVWRGKVYFRGMEDSGRIRHNGFGGAISHQNDADDLVRELTAKLKADKLL